MTIFKALHSRTLHKLQPWIEMAPKGSKDLENAITESSSIHINSLIAKSPVVMRWCFIAAYLPYLLVGPPSISANRNPQTSDEIRAASTRKGSTSAGMLQFRLNSEAC